ncbi:uncharacterized protein [Penaeus vannamei]|uniref:uncharacterized protein n=1 Tax=Penaeus vannamei TaxID=6689 RepID=UPI00387F9C58
MSPLRVLRPHPTPPPPPATRADDEAGRSPARQCVLSPPASESQVQEILDPTHQLGVQSQPWPRVSRSPCASSWRRRCWRRARRPWKDLRSAACRAWSPLLTGMTSRQAGGPTSPARPACAPPPSSWCQRNPAVVCRSLRSRKSKGRSGAQDTASRCGNEDKSDMRLARTAASFRDD